MKGPLLCRLGVISFNVSRWVDLISSAVRSLQASLAPLFGVDAFALVAGAAFRLFVAGADTFTVDFDCNVCAGDDCSLQPAIKEASRTANMYSIRWLVMDIQTLTLECGGLPPLCYCRSSQDFLNRCLFEVTSATRLPHSKRGLPPVSVLRSAS